MQSARHAHDAASAGLTYLLVASASPAELFFVLEGELDFQVNDDLTSIGPREWLLASRGTPHTFANHSTAPARVLIAVTPADFERYFRLVSAQLTGSQPPADAYGPRPVTEQLGPPIRRGSERDTPEAR
jgi:Cupin domain